MFRQFWAEPDIASSAKILEKVVNKRKKYGLPNKDISKELSKIFFCIKSGKKYIKRLKIWVLFHKASVNFE